MRIEGLHLINDGTQVVCLPGTTLFHLEKALDKIGRAPHSVIGSSCIGASVFGGVCNNSGGALIHRGPAFTQLALFARLDEAGGLHLVNHLGIALGNDPETILRRVENGEFTLASFNCAEVYGKDTFVVIHYLGTDMIPRLFALQAAFDNLCRRFSFLPKNLSAKMLQALSHLFPKHLPRRMTDYRDRFEHYLLLKMGDDGIAEARAYLKSIFPSKTGDYFECTPDEGDKAFLHRFAAAGAAIRYRAVHDRQVEDIVAL
jgi:FAD/FMN-containing dehydrogenase